MTVPPREAKSNDRPESPLSLELQEMLAAASSAHAVSIVALRDAVCQYLHHLRQSGVARDEAIQAIRALVCSQRPSKTAPDEKRLHERILAWCVEVWPARS